MRTETVNRELESLRQELHDAIDRELDRFRAGAFAAGGEPSTNVEATVSLGETTGEWPYTWPGGKEEAFFETRWYELSSAHGEQRVRVAWTRRPAWGRDDRARAVVFHQLGPSTYYPWTEFVETDDGRYAAPIPDPRRPRAMLSAGAVPPARFSGSTVERSDRLFSSIADGPSLRLVVEKQDEIAMVAHGYWVAVLRHRI